MGPHRQISLTRIQRFKSLQTTTKSCEAQTLTKQKLKHAQWRQRRLCLGPISRSEQTGFRHFLTCLTKWSFLSHRLQLLILQRRCCVANSASAIFRRRERGGRRCSTQLLGFRYRRLGARGSNAAVKALMEETEKVGEEGSRALPWRSPHLIRASAKLSSLFGKRLVLLLDLAME